MQGNEYNKKVLQPNPKKQASVIGKYQCCRTIITNYLVGGSAVDKKVSVGETEALPCVRNRQLHYHPQDSW